MTPPSVFSPKCRSCVLLFCSSMVCVALVCRKCCQTRFLLWPWGCIPDLATMYFFHIVIIFIFCVDAFMWFLIGQLLSLFFYSFIYLFVALKSLPFPRGKSGTESSIVRSCSIRGTSRITQRPLCSCKPVHLAWCCEQRPSGNALLASLRTRIFESHTRNNGVWEAFLAHCNFCSIL